jgi:pyrroloquinoline-quinone synthase
MTAIERMETAIAQWNLLESKFYRAWSAGTLPVEALRVYAREYGAYIALVPGGWERHGDSKTAAVEVGHVELWRRFAAGLGTDIGAAVHPSVASLVRLTEEAFSSAAASLGALYAFEVQQPKTAATKLEGLKAHYDVPETAAKYFRVHADDEEEIALLRERIEALGTADREEAVSACEATCIALRAALDGLYDSYGQAAACSM